PRAITYGLDNWTSPFGAIATELSGFGSQSTAVRRTGGKDEPLGALTLAVPGRPIVGNALAATAVAMELGVPFETIAGALSEFRGTARRFERKGEAKGATVVDDYVHHPTEIAAVLR